MATLQITAYTPAKAAFGDKPISAAELKRMPEPYKFGPAVDKYRRLPKTPENIKAHGDAICAAVRSKHRSALNKVLTPISPSCASGTWEADGQGVLKAIARQHRSALDGALAASWRARTNEQVRKAYEAAMRGEDAPLTNNI